MSEELKQWAEKIDALSSREQALLFACAAVIVVMLLQLLIVDPLLEERSKMSSRQQVLERQLENDEHEQLMLQQMLAAGVNRQQQERRLQLQQEVAELDGQIEQSVVALIPPKLMTEVLQTLLIESRGLSLVGLENMPVEALLVQPLEDDEPVAESPASGLYRHGFTLRLKGDYLATIRYLERLSALPWRFHWDSLHYAVDSYPEAEIRIEVHTVSMSEEWIGV